jgi:hypothetical protein
MGHPYITTKDIRKELEKKFDSISPEQVQRAIYHWHKHSPAVIEHITGEHGRWTTVEKSFTSSVCSYQTQKDNRTYCTKLRRFIADFREVCGFVYSSECVEGNFVKTRKPHCKFFCCQSASENKKNIN